MAKLVSLGVDADLSRAGYESLGTSPPGESINHKSGVSQSDMG